MQLECIKTPAKSAARTIRLGYGLKHDRNGDFVHKPMAQCTGKEILEEVLRHLQFKEGREAIVASSDLIPCMMPYITSQFLVRKAGDRPEIIPAGSINQAFIGQYCEQPDEVVFTVEYSIRSAQAAVYQLLKPTLYRRRPTKERTIRAFCLEPSKCCTDEFAGSIAGYVQETASAQRIDFVTWPLANVTLSLGAHTPPTDPRCFISAAPSASLRMCAPTRRGLRRVLPTQDTADELGAIPAIGFSNYTPDMILDGR